MFSWGLTVFAWHLATQSANAELRSEFATATDETARRLARRMGVYEQILRASRGFLRNSVFVSRQEYREYIENLNLHEVFPGIQGIGVAQLVLPSALEAHVAAFRTEDPHYHVWPPGKRPVYSAITRLEPFNVMNQRAIGYDMFSEPVRRAAMERARDTGRAALSGHVTLVQEGKGNGQPGFLMYLPLYAKDMPTDTVQQRRIALQGWVYAPFRMHDLIRSALPDSLDDLNVRIYDGSVASGPDCMYGCEARKHDSLLQMRRTVQIAGRDWLLDMRSTPALERKLDRATPRLTLGGGLLAGVLLAAFIWSLAAGRSRALALAHEMTNELRASNARIEVDRRRTRSILENSLDAFVAMNRDGTVTDWNAAAARLFGWRAEEAIGRSLRELILPHDGTQERQALQQLLHAEQESSDGIHGQRLEVQAQHRDGRSLPVELALATVDDAAGFVAHAFIRDLSPERETAQRDARQRRQLEEARTALQHAQRLEALGKLTGGVAHDFNNVLQIISGNIQLMQYFSGGNPALDARLEAAMQAVDRGARLSSQLLSFARRQPLQPQVVNLGALVQDMMDLIRRAAGEEIEIACKFSDALGNARVDPTQLENVVLNLVINARDAMKGRGTLTLELANVELGADDVAAFPDTRPGEYVMLAVSDTGSGMTPEVLDHAFEPFFTTKARGGGTGLGLSMAYGFVKQSEGHIRLYSEPGVGTTVRVYLPRTRESEAAMDGHDEPDPVPGGSETILVVEDDAQVQATVVPLLRALGYHVSTANNGDDASEILASGHHFDLLFTDVVMPGQISSTELVSQAKARDPGMAVLFTSGYTEDAIVHGGRLDPGVHLLSKPYRRDELARKVRQVLDMRGRKQVRMA